MTTPQEPGPEQNSDEETQEIEQQTVIINAADLQEIQDKRDELELLVADLNKQLKKQIKKQDRHDRMYLKVFKYRVRPRPPLPPSLVLGTLATVAALFFISHDAADRGGPPPSIERIEEYSSNHSGWLESVDAWRGEVLLGIALTLFLFGFFKAIRSYKLAKGIKRPPWLVASLLGVITLAIAGLSAWVLLREADKVAPDERPKTRIEAIKTAGTVALGTSGLGAFFLGARRFWTGESEKTDEKYFKAVELLGSESSQVRVSGLVALQILARKNPELETGIAHILHYVSTSRTRMANESEPRFARAFGEDAVAEQLLDDLGRHFRQTIRVQQKEIE
ncbi:hypothetical protein AB0M35_05690 [Micromonospora sp. NPDC051196]|uniref:hypothetical protein n=1 Tax=Micromonospora sp. NPDC051196 TaxID=3155281 RepID=UPI00342C57C3